MLHKITMNIFTASDLTNQINSKTSNMMPANSHIHTRLSNEDTDICIYKRLTLFEYCVPGFY